MPDTRTENGSVATRTENGSVAADISRRAVQILREYTGRGPTKARTVISKDTVAIVLADTLTKGEHSLVGMGEEEHVLRTRRNYQELMRNDLVGLVEEMTGQKVHAFFSDNHIEPDYGVEFFLLTPIPGTEAEQPDPGTGAEQPAPRTQAEQVPV